MDKLSGLSLRDYKIHSKLKFPNPFHKLHNKRTLHQHKVSDPEGSAGGASGLLLARRH